MCFYKKIILILLLAVFSSGVSMAEIDNNWLVGVWELVDESKQEFMEFKEKTVSLVSGRGRKINGNYKLTDSVVKIIYKFKGKKIPIDLNYSSTKDMLTGSLSNTGKTVRYTKKQ